MSGVEERMAAKQENDWLRARYEKNRQLIERNRKIESGQAAATMFAAMAYGDALESSSFFQKAAHAAKLTCIAAVFIIPNLLFIRVMF